MYPNDTICLMHDGVRPMIDHDIISQNIESVEKFGSAVTVAQAVETIAVRGSDNKVGQIIDRSKCHGEGTAVFPFRRTVKGSSGVC